MVFSLQSGTFVGQLADTINDEIDNFLSCNHNYDTYYIQNKHGTSKQRLDYAFQSGVV
jgi:hypothetical protein